MDSYEDRTDRFMKGEMTDQYGQVKRLMNRYICQYLDKCADKQIDQWIDEQIKKYIDKNIDLLAN